MASADNIAIRQTWIEEHTTKLAAELKESEDDAFLYLAASLLLGTSPDEIEAEDIVDGAQDKQVDFIHIEDNSDGEAEIVIIQSKNTRGFGSNTLIQLRNGLTWIFEKPRAQFSKLQNESFKSKINEVRQVKTEQCAFSMSVMETRRTYPPSTSKRSRRFATNTPTSASVSSSLKPLARVSSSTS
jgi:DNA primase large subunit